MCIKIICSESESEFNLAESLEQQIADAKEIVVSYDPMDPKIDCFVSQVECMVKNGASFKADITVKPNNKLDGLKLQRKIEKLKLKLNVNEVVKGLSNLHSETDRKLCEISEMCLGKLDER